MAAASTSMNLDAAIIAYLPTLDNVQKEAVLNVLKAFSSSSATENHWEDPSFVAEIAKRDEDYRTGRVKMHSFEEFKAAGRRAVDEIRKGNIQ